MISMEDNLHERNLKWKLTSMEMTSMEDNIIDREQLRKKGIKEDLNERQYQWKTDLGNTAILS